MRRLTQRQLKRIIREALEKVDWDNPDLSWGPNDQDNWEREQRQQPGSESTPDMEIAYKFRADIDSGVDLEEAWLAVRQALEDNYPDRDARWEVARALQYNPLTKEIEDDLELYKDEGIFPDY